MGSWKFVKVTLRLIEWSDKKTGEAQSCYAYSSGGASSSTVFGSKTNASLNIRVGGERINKPASGITLWLNDMTSEEYDLYVEAGNTQAYIGIQGDLANPVDSKVITNEEYNALQSPSMLFQHA